MTLNALALDNLERGWAVGWKDEGQVTQPGNIQYLRAPVLVRLSGDTATDVAPRRCSIRSNRRRGSTR